MRRRAILRSLVLFVCLIAGGCVAQQLESVAASKPSGQSPAVRQSAMNMIEEALAGTGSLALPSNRLAIEQRAFPIVWSRSDARARALVQQMAGEFGQAASALKQDPDQNPAYALNYLRNQRNSIARGIANNDPELALLFLSATLPYLRLISPDDDAEDHALVVDLAAQVALRDPRRALQLAEQQLKETDDLPQSMIGLLDQVQQNDAQTGNHLFRDIVDHLRQQNLAEDTEALSFSSSLLASQFSRQSEMGKPDDELLTLAEAVADAGLSSNITQDEPYALNDAMAALDALVPAKSAALHKRNTPPVQFSTQNQFWQRFNHARSTGDTNQVVALLSRAPEDARSEALDQAVLDFANNGDLERTRQVADSLEPWRRNSMMQLAIRNAALVAASRSDFSAARGFSAQITDDDSRVSLLSDLAIFANAKSKPNLAEEMLGQATSLVMNRTGSASAFAAQLKVAQAYLRVKPALAIPLLERSANQIDQALSAAAQLDGFLPDRHSFEGSELILNQGFLYTSLLEPYAQAAAELATLDLPAARTLADRLPLPEARLMAEVCVAAGVLEKKDQTQAASNQSMGVELLRDNR